MLNQSFQSSLQICLPKDFQSLKFRHLFQSSSPTFPSNSLIAANNYFDSNDRTSGQYLPDTIITGKAEDSFWEMPDLYTLDSSNSNTMHSVHCTLYLRYSSLAN